MLAFKRLDPKQRDHLLDDGWALGQWLKEIPEEPTRQLRHRILFLLFPETFVRRLLAALVILLGGRYESWRTGRVTGLELLLGPDSGGI